MPPVTAVLRNLAQASYRSWHDVERAVENFNKSTGFEYQFIEPTTVDGVNKYVCRSEGPFDHPCSSSFEFLLTNLGYRAVNIEYRHTHEDIPEMISSTLHGLGSNCHVVNYNETGNLEMIAFTTEDLKNVFQRYPESLHCDCTCNVSVCGFKLYHMAVIDRYGCTQSVFFAFILEKTVKFICDVFKAFKQLMGDLSNISTVVIDKDEEELKAVRQYLNPKRVLYCGFFTLTRLNQMVKHYIPKESQCRKYILEQIRSALYAADSDEFNTCLENLEFMAPAFWDQFKTDWLSRIDTWAMYTRQDCVTFDGDTNNRCKGQSKNFKDCITRPWSFAQTIYDIVAWHYTQLHGRTLMAFRDCNSVIHCFETSEFPVLLRKVTSFAGRKIYDDLQAKTTDDNVVVNLGTGKCVCRLNRNWLIPCRHLLNLYKTVGMNTEELIVNSRWLKITTTEEIHDYSTFPADFRARQREYVIAHGGTPNDNPYLPVVSNAPSAEELALLTPRERTHARKRMQMKICEFRSSKQKKH